MSKTILAINPGSTSTKIAIYSDKEVILKESIQHSTEELAAFASALDQFDYRKELVISTIHKHGIPFRFDAIIGRGGLTRPIEGGVWEVNDKMIDDVRHAPRDHACNLGCLIAHDLALTLPACKAFIADPGIVDEMEDIARISGSPLLPRMTTWHALNQRAIARRFAEERAAEQQKKIRYEDLNLIIAHIGGGISIAAHCKGRAVDVNNAFDGEGPFSPERTGSLPTGQLIDLCFSQRFTHAELRRYISGQSGLTAHLGTNDIPAIIARIHGGDSHAEQVLDAMLYQIAKGITALAAYFAGDIDAILLTGGMAHSEYITSRIAARVQFLAPVTIYPGEDEMEAMAMNALGALNGEIAIKQYQSIARDKDAQ